MEGEESVDRCNAPEVDLSRHALHLPEGPIAPPQAHLRCSRLLRVGNENDDASAAGLIRVSLCVVIGMLFYLNDSIAAKPKSA